MQKGKPVSKGEKIKINITGLSHDGSGVGKIDGFTFFVPETTPGDTVEAQVISIQKNHGRALPLKIIKAADTRTEPFCDYYSRCGGCQLQHIKYEEQLRLKEILVNDSLKRIGKINCSVNPVIGMDNPRNYRNKAQVPIACDGKEIVAGFYERRSHKIVDIESCPIQDEQNNKSIQIDRLRLSAML